MSSSFNIFYKLTGRTPQTTQTARANYENPKPDTEALKKQAAEGKKGTVESYHPFENPNLNGESTKYYNGNEVCIWDSEYGRSTSVKIGNTIYYDFESDGKIDCVDTVIKK